MLHKTALQSLTSCNFLKNQLRAQLKNTHLAKLLFWRPCFHSQEFYLRQRLLQMCDELVFRLLQVL